MGIFLGGKKVKAILNKKEASTVLCSVIKHALRGSGRVLYEQRSVGENMRRSGVFFPTS